MEFLSSVFQPIVNLMSTLVTYAFQLTQMVGYPSYGVAIILLTIVIKAILAPLTVKQIKSMKAMQELQPRMKELQDKYKNDPAKLQAEMGALYKEMGVNPLAELLASIGANAILDRYLLRFTKLSIRSKLCTVLMAS